MIFKRIYLREDDPEIYLDTYVADCDKVKCDAMLVIPGGGYSRVCSDREGEPVAFQYLAKGINSFVLHYSVGEKAKFPRPLCDASLAVAYIREHADEYSINPDRIFAVGFSAGGHLAGALGTLWDMPEVYEETDISYGKNRPNGIILCYPVISGGDIAHKPSFWNLLGNKNPTDEELAAYSLENCVKKETAVPMYAFHTAGDDLVPVQNSLALASAYANVGIPFELHVFPYGGHGLALANRLTSFGNAWREDKNVEKWVELSVEWMKALR